MNRGAKKLLVGGMVAGGLMSFGAAAGLVVGGGVSCLHGIIAGREYRYVAHPSLRRHADGLEVAL
jgi:hypothetical protein